jgi:hypothetical protein
MKDQFEDRKQSIAEREAELWNQGSVIDFAYLYDPDAMLICPPRHHEVTREVLDAFSDRLEEARGRKLTGRPLSDALGELGELFAAIMFGIKLHAPMTQGSDGVLANELVEVKTITPIKKTNAVRIKRTGDFSRIVVVKITKDFQFGARMANRRILKHGPGLWATLSWDEMILGAGKSALEVHRKFPVPKAAV